MRKGSTNNHDNGNSTEVILTLKACGQRTFLKNLIYIHLLQSCMLITDRLLGKKKKKGDIITICAGGEDDRESLTFKEFSCILIMDNGGNHFATAIRIYRIPFNM